MAATAAGHTATVKTQQPLLTRADIQDEVAAALAGFAENALRRELGHLGAQIQRAIQEAQTAVATAKLPAGLAGAGADEEEAPFRGPHSVSSMTTMASPMLAPVGRDQDEWCTLRRKDLIDALDEWWAMRKGAPNAKEVAPTPSILKRQPSPSSTSGGTGSANSGDSGETNLTPPASPFSLLPAAITVSTGSLGETFVQDPFASTLSTPSNGPTTPSTMMMSSLSSSGRKDWRRSFVEKAVFGHRKIEYLSGSQCRETHEVHTVMEEAIRALEEGVKPHLVEDGLGGTYFLKDCDGSSIAVFKPRDEEPLAPNNPKVHAGQGKGAGLKDGTLVGDAAISEYAAFLVDQASSPTMQAGVCPTALVRVAHSVFHSPKEGRHSAFRVIKDKVGSLQVFAQHDCTSEDMGPGLFPDEQVHKLAALDIRLCNTDRHSGNILVRQKGRESIELVPIDHGYALPGEVGGATFEWLSWPAARRPFSEALRREILAFDVDSVEAGLRRKVPALRDESCITLKICSMLLKCGVEAGLTAFDIGTLMTRPDEDFDVEDGQGVGSQAEGTSQRLSELETLVAEAKRRAKASECNSYFHYLDEVFRARCAEVAEDRELSRP